MTLSVHTDETSRIAAPVEPGVLFDAALYPHRSLGPRGFLILMAVIGGVNFIAGIAFILAGAWPIVGFCGLDVLLLYLAFRINYRAARHYEAVRLTENTLSVARIGPEGLRERIDFPAYWVRVQMDDPPEHYSQVRITSHGRSIIVGSFLSPPERLDFARALQSALVRLRSPKFDP